MSTAKQNKSGADWNSYNYDHHSSKVAYDPADLWKRLQEERPVIHSDNYGGFWFVSRYADVSKALVDCGTFSSAQGVLLPSGKTRLIPIEVDPPLQGQYRKLLNGALSPGRMAECEGWIRAAAQEQIAKIAHLERFEFCSEFASPFPKGVALRVIGFPDEDLPQLNEWIAKLGTDRHAHAADAAEIDRKLTSYLSDTLDERMESSARDDLISVVLDTKIDGELIPRQDQISMLMLLLFGGLETTTAVLSTAILWLASHPEDQQRLRNQPELMGTAVEEFVRFSSPAAHQSRVTTKDTSIGGCPIPAGARVMLGHAAANRDHAAFECPNEVVLDRYPNRHLGFGIGPHRCVGSHLGKLQVRVGLEEFLRAFRQIEVEDYGLLRWEGGEARGLINLPLRVSGI